MVDNSQAIAAALLGWNQQPELATALALRGQQLFNSQQGAVDNFVQGSKKLLSLQSFVKKQEISSFLWADNDFFSEPSAELLAPEFWQNQHAVVGKSKGRNTVW